MDIVNINANVDILGLELGFYRICFHFESLFVLFIINSSLPFIVYNTPVIESYLKDTPIGIITDSQLRPLGFTYYYPFFF